MRDVIGWEIWLAEISDWMNDSTWSLCPRVRMKKACSSKAGGGVGWRACLVY